MSPRIKSHSAADSEEKKHQSSRVDAHLPAFRTVLTEWFEVEGRDLPWRHTSDPYAILVSEMMLQQTQVATVISYFQRWMRRFPDIATLAQADEQQVLELWQGLGYYSRARNLHRAAKAIIETHCGVFPTKLDDIRALPGIGRYTAAAVATFAFNQPVPPVDGNIARVLSRLLNAYEPVDSSAGLEHLWITATRWQPARDPGFYNEAMMELGALICTPRAPRCLICPVSNYCEATAPEELPVKKPRRKTIALSEACGWVIHRGKIALEQQTGTRWKGLWKLPKLIEAGQGSSLLQLDYPFTHHRITLQVYAAKADELAAGYDWQPIASLKELPITAPHRRAIEQLLK